MKMVYTSMVGNISTSREWNSPVLPVISLHHPGHWMGISVSREVVSIVSGGEREQQHCGEGKV